MALFFCVHASAYLALLHHRIVSGLVTIAAARTIDFSVTCVTNSSFEFPEATKSKKPNVNELRSRVHLLLLTGRINNSPQGVAEKGSSRKVSFHIAISSRNA